MAQCTLATLHRVERPKWSIVRQIAFMVIAGMLLLLSTTEASADIGGLKQCPENITTQDVCYMPVPDDYDGPVQDSETYVDEEVKLVEVYDPNSETGYTAVLLVQPSESSADTSLSIGDQEIQVQDNEVGPQNLVQYDPPVEIIEPQATDPEITEPETIDPKITEPETVDPDVSGPDLVWPEGSECASRGIGAHATANGWLLCWSGNLVTSNPGDPTAAVEDLDGDADPFHLGGWTVFVDCFPQQGEAAARCKTYNAEHE